ncbi:MAG: hypothetical protein L0312_12535, partial [Acidobacteria bacterium]|nr:hypothetical protein [Acidobacteriota bacterium]
MALCIALPITQGYGAVVVEQTYNRARELCEQLGERVQLFRTLRGLRNVYLFQARSKTALEICEQMLSLARSASDADLLVQAHASTSVILFHLGEFAAARDHFEQGLALFDQRQRHVHLSQYGHDPGASLQCAGAWALWFLGYPDQSLEKIREAITLAKEVRHPENLCTTLFYAAFLHQVRREAQRTLEQAEALIAQADEYGLVAWSVVGTSLRGWALVELGHRSEGIAQIRQTLIAHSEVGSEIARLHFRSLLAESLMKDEQIEEGLAVLDEALTATRGAGGYYFLAELHRLKGELLLKSEAGNSQTEAEGYFRQSIEIARRQQAKSLELRAAMSLSRLRRKQGKTQEARQMLLEIYRWFTEGFDGADLKEARSLLKELS